MDIFGIGPLELVFVLVVALLVLGPGKMVDVAKNLGKVVRELQRATAELPKLVSLEDEKPTPPPERQQISESPPKDSQEPPSQGAVPRE